MMEQDAAPRAGDERSSHAPGPRAVPRPAATTSRLPGAG
jgi:hypothetical protein